MALGKNPTVVTTVEEAISTSGYSSQFVGTVSSGMTTASELTRQLNRNAAFLEVTSFYGSGDGVISGLTIDSGGLVSSGRAFIGAYVELNEDVQLESLSFETTLYVWLTTAGDVVTTNTNTAPNNSIKLGRVYKLGDKFYVSNSERPVMWQGSSYALVPDTDTDWNAQIIQTPFGIYTWTPFSGWALISPIVWMTVVNNLYVPENSEVSFTGDWVSEGSFGLGGNITWLD